MPHASRLATSTIAPVLPVRSRVAAAPAPTPALALAPALLLALTSVLTPVAVLAAGAAHADGSAATPAATLDDVGRELAATTERLAELDAEIAAGRALRQELEASVEAAESSVGERRERVAALAADIDRFERRLADLETRVAGERSGIEARRERLARTLRVTRRTGTASGLRTLLGHDDPALAARLGVYADYALRAQRRSIDAQALVLARLETAREATLKDRNWLEHIKGKAARQRDARAAERRERVERLASVDGELESKARSVAELAADRERLQTLMDELEVLQSAASGYFAEGRGGYAWPVDGRLEARFGDVKSVGRLRWTGLFVAAPEGAPVRAVADGEIVYADRLRGFGLLVVVDHGDDFMTLYGGNRAVTESVGAWVEAGARIATVGESGGQNASGVYFEVRENAEPIDPEPWLTPRADSGRVAGG